MTPYIVAAITGLGGSAERKPAAAWAMPASAPAALARMRSDSWLMPAMSTTE